MAKFLAFAAVIVLIAVVSAAELPRSSRRFRNRSRFLARQEIAEDIPVQTPYPPAGEKPDVEFDLPEDESVGFGDKNVIGAPDQTYGPPEAEAVPIAPQEDFSVVPESQRFTSIRGNNRFAQQGRLTKLAPLRKAAPPRQASVQFQQLQQASVQLQPLQQDPIQLQPLQQAPVRLQQLQQAPAQVQQLQQQLFAQPILLADGRVVYSILA